MIRTEHAAFLCMSERAGRPVSGYVPGRRYVRRTEGRFSMFAGIFLAVMAVTMTWSALG